MTWGTPNKRGQEYWLAVYCTSNRRGPRILPRDTSNKRPQEYWPAVNQTKGAQNTDLRYSKQNTDLLYSKQKGSQSTDLRYTKQKTPRILTCGIPNWRGPRMLPCVTPKGRDPKVLPCGTFSKRAQEYWPVVHHWTEGSKNIALRYSKQKGPRILTCGNPQVMMTGSELTLLTLTICLLSPNRGQTHTLKFGT